MNMNNMFIFSFKAFFLILIFADLVETILSANQQYEACKPKDCGDGLAISYPFWIHDEHQPYCGLSVFQINCIEDKPTLRLSNIQYVVRNISYETHSILVVDSRVLHENCPTPLHNTSISGAPFRLATNYIELYFFYNCTSLPTRYFTYPVLCASSPSTSLHSFAAFLQEVGLEHLNATTENCQSMVNTPVDVQQDRMTNDRLVKMSYLDILREGFLLNWPTSDGCRECEASAGHCGFEHNQFVCFCPDRPQRSFCRKDANPGLKVGIGAGTGIAGMILSILVFLYYKYHSLTDYIIFWKRKNESQRLVEEFFKRYGSLAPKRYNYDDIKKITGSFKEKIGEGGYGCVYKGKLIDSRVVAVKLLNKAKGDGQEFINEVASISRTSHVNVVSLLGFCFDGSKRALIYEFMANGSLEKFIFNQNPVEAQFHLGWKSLYKIAVGVARGLEYLHRGCNTRILHFDIKPHNILLDQHFVPKISDFGLAKLCPRNESIISMLDARGTAGYIAPEVFDKNFGRVSHKSDVYSYGKMVLEIVGRRKNIDVGVDHTSEIYFPHWIYKRLEIDEGLGLDGVVSTEEEKLVRKMILVALWCIQTNPANRPAMTKVVEMLEGGVELLHIPPQPNF